MLSKRLREVAKFIDKGKVVYDVGSDHALLPCFLVQEKICDRVYACDNKQGPLNKAIENIRRFNLEDKIIPVLANGIDKISPDVNIITICGMGFYTVKTILENKELYAYDKIIVQVNKNTNLLRKWISDNMYTIIDESIVFEDDKFYEIVVFRALRTRPLDELEITYGPYLMAHASPVFKKYLQFQRDKYQKIAEKADVKAYKNKIQEIDDIIGRIFGGN